MELVMKLLPLFVCFCLLFCWILNQAYNDSLCDIRDDVKHNESNCLNTLTLVYFRAWWDISDHVLELSVLPWQPYVGLEELSGDAFIMW